MSARVLVTGMTANRGGVESVVANYVRHCDPDIQFDVWCSGPDCAFAHDLRERGSRIFRGRAYSADPLGAHRDAQKFFAAHGHEYDVLWSNKSMLANLDDLRLARRYGLRRRIIHAHNSRNMFDGATGAVKGLLHRVHRRAVRSLATDYWACSTGAAHYFFPAHVLDSPRFRLVRNAVDPATYRFRPDVRRRVRRELGVPDATTVLGFVGRLEYQKNPQFLIRVFSEYHKRDPQSVLVVAGDGELRDECQSLCQTLGVVPFVRFLGSRGDVPALYQAMDALLLPSRFEGLPVVLVEAQTAGLPCLASDTITPDTRFTDSLRFLSLAADLKSWARELGELLRSAGDRSLSMSSREAASYDITFAAYNLSRVFRKASRGGASSTSRFARTDPRR